MNKKSLAKLQFIKKNFFLLPSGKNYNNLLNLVKLALIDLVKHQGDGPTYPEVTSTKKSLNMFKIKNPKEVINQLHNDLGGAVKANSPFMVKNIIPLPSFVSLSSYLASSLLMANAVTGEDSGRILNCEKNVSHFMSNLIGLNKKKSAGFFTWGGTATNFYALKIGLSKVEPSHGKTGLSGGVVAIESWPAHYSHKTAMNWLGLGEENLVKVKSNQDQTTNLKDLYEKIESCIKQNKKIACIFCNGGTTSNVSIDNIKEIAKIRDRLVNKYKLHYTPHIHADTVTGWAYSVFRFYNLNKNKMGLGSEMINHLKKIKNLISFLNYADSFGIDFHKTGYTQYNSSFFLVNDSRDLDFLLKDKKYIAPLFHNKQVYNPGLLFTMETSRPSAVILATWLHLKSLGIEGLQILLTNNLENAFFIRKLFNSKEAKNRGILIINPNFFGSDVYLRFFLSERPDLEHDKERLDEMLIIKNNIFTKKFFNFINHKKKYSKKFSVSYTSAAFYNENGIAITGIRIYLLNPCINKNTLKKLYTNIIQAYKDFRDKENGK